MGWDEESKFSLLMISIIFFFLGISCEIGVYRTFFFLSFSVIVFHLLLKEVLLLLNYEFNQLLQTFDSILSIL